MTPQFLQWPAVQRLLPRIILVALTLAGLLTAARLLVLPDRGLQAEYFIGDQTIGAPAIVAVDRTLSTVQIARRWAGAAPASFSVRWFGFLTVARAGRYTFATTSDDGSAMLIDGRLLVDNGGLHGPILKTASVALTAGAHPVLVELTQAGGTFAFEWQWSREGGDLGTVPTWALTPYKVAPWRVGVARALDLSACVAVSVGLLALLWRVLSARWTAARHPRAAAFVLFIVFAVVHTWPMASDPGHLARHDNRDTILNEWIVAWVVHQATHAPLHLFDANIFYPERYTLAYSEPMIVQAAIGAPMIWLGASPVLTYNLLLMLGFALSGWSMCLVVRRWTGDWTAGLVSGLVFGFCAHTLTRIPHLQAQHAEFLPMALLALDTLLLRPTARRGVVLALWCVLQGLTSLYLLAITLFTMTAAVVSRADNWWGREGLPVLRALSATVLVAGVALLPFLLPYYHVSAEQGLTRSLGDAANYSASWSDYLTTPSRLHVSTWSGRFAGGTGLFPGALGLLLAALALARGAAFRDRRARMCLAVGLAGLYLSFGPKMPGYAALYAALPLLHGIRATARFGYMVTLSVAVLAGFGVVSLRSLVPARAWPTLAVLLVAASGLESLAAPLGLSRFDGIAPVYDRLPRAPGTVVVEVPFAGPRSAQFHAHAMLNSTRHWQPLVNGYSGFQAPSFYPHAEALQGFPDDRSIAMMRTIGVTHVFVHTSQYELDALEALRARRELEKVDQFGDTELYRVR